MFESDKIEFNPLRLCVNLASYGTTATFYHSGDLGDIVFSLPTIRALGGGVLVLGPEMSTPIKARSPINAMGFHNLAPLIAQQSYITKVVFSELMPQDARFDLNAWRIPYFGLRGHLSAEDRKTIARAHLATFGADRSHENRQWLQVDRPERAADVICSRNLRCPNPKFPWPKILAAYRGLTAFVGTEREHAEFSRQFGVIPYVQTRSLLDVARVIAACRLFVGNQSCPYAIAEGLKMSAIQEVYPEHACCQFERPDVQLVWDEQVKLPEL